MSASRTVVTPNADRRARASAPGLQSRRGPRAAALLQGNRHVLRCRALGGDRRLRRFGRPALLSGSSGSCRPSEPRTPSAITKAGPGHARRLLVEAAHHYRYQPHIGVTLARRQHGQDPRVIEIGWRAQRRLHQRWQHLHQQRRKPRASSRSRAPASSPRSSGRQQPLTDHTPTIVPGTLPGRARASGRPSTLARRPAVLLWAADPGRPRPLLDSEPRRTPGLEVSPRISV